MGIGAVLPAVLAGGASLGGSLADLYISGRSRDRNEAMQKEFAQAGIRWKVEDAKAAGIHPVYALGASTHSFNPVTVGSDFGRAGQDISRAIYATRTAEERNLEAERLRLEHMRLQNELLSSQIAKLNASPNPPLPSNSDMPLLTGQGNSTRSASGYAYVDEKPLSRVHSLPGRPEQEVGAISDVGLVRVKDGYELVPSQDIKQRIEDQFFPEMMWAMRNYVLPLMSSSLGPGPLDPRYYPLPKGYNRWRWNGVRYKAEKTDLRTPSYLKSNYKERR